MFQYVHHICGDGIVRSGVVIVPDTTPAATERLEGVLPGSVRLDTKHRHVARVARNLLQITSDPCTLS